MSASWVTANNTAHCFGIGTHADRPADPTTLPSSRKDSLIFFQETDTSGHFVWDWVTNSWVPTNFIIPDVDV